jgi:hypothetical protein
MVQSDSRIYHVLICIRIPERIGTLVIRFFDVLVERCSSLLQSFIYQLLFVGESKEDVSEADLLATRELICDMLLEYGN